MHRPTSSIPSGPDQPLRCFVDRIPLFRVVEFESDTVVRSGCSYIAVLLAVATGAVLGAPARQPLHLDSPVDRDAFRRWFTFLAESQFYAGRPSPAINDCAALVRWSFVETLVPHDSTWANTLNLSIVPAIPPIRQFAWPRTPVGADIFRTGDTSAGQFADATTLRRYNTYFISGSLVRAMPGDLIFYRQFGRLMPAHVMIYVGPSQFEPSSQRWIVYHTGPSEKTPGEIRKVSVDDLLAHPGPEWRPVAGNSNFLGVWRLNILRAAE